MKITPQSSQRPTPGKEDQELLDELQYNDFGPFRQSFELNLRWFDFMPIHYLLSLSLLIFVASKITGVEIERILFYSIPAAMIVMLIALLKAGSIYKEAFETRFSSSRKIAYTRVITKPELIPEYRLYLRLIFFGIEFFITALTVIYFNNQ